MVKSRETLADLSLLGVATIWGVTFLIVQESIREIPVFAFLSWRFLLATALFFLLGFVLRLLHANASSIQAGVILGILLSGGYSFQTLSLQYSLSSVAGFITGLSVVFVPFFMWVIFKNRQSKITLFGICISIVGLWMISTNGGAIPLGKGELFALIGSAFFAFHIIYTGIFSLHHRLFTLVLAQFSTATLLMFFLSFLFDPYTIPETFSYSLLKAICITAIFATVLAFLVQTYTQRFTTPAKVAVIFTAEPFMAGIFGCYYGGEALGTMQILGGVLIIFSMLSVELGTVLYRRTRRS